MIDGHYWFTTKSEADTAIAAAGFSNSGDGLTFTHPTGFGKFWGDEYQTPIGQPVLEDPENPSGNWIHLDGFYFHCRMYSGALPSELNDYLIVDPARWYETY